MVEEDPLHGAGGPAVLFEFDDDGVPEGRFQPGAEVLEPQVRVDGNPLRQGGIHQCDAVEGRFQRGLDFLRPEVGPVVEVPAGGGIGPEIRELVHGDSGALFLCPPAVVLPLDLEESLAGIDIGARADFLPMEFLVPVVGEHPEAVGVEVDGVVRADAGTVGDEDAVAGGGRILQDREERPVIREIFRVHPVHQAHGVHLLEGDGRKSFQGAGKRYDRVLRHPR